VTTRWIPIALLALLFPFPLAAAGWMIQSPPVDTWLEGLSVVTETEGWACGAQGVILHTSDGGENWSVQPSGVPDAFWTGISFADAGVGVAAGIGGTGFVLAWTKDGGTTWHPAFGGEFESLMDVHMVTPEIGYTVGGLPTRLALVGKTTDGGRSWNWNSFPIHGQQATLFGVRFVGPVVGFATASLDAGGGAIVRTTDGGDSWHEVFRGPYSLWDIDFSDADHGWACGDAGRVYRTTDGGDTWSAGPTDTALSLRGISSRHPGVATVVGNEGFIARTLDGGLTWHVQDAGTSRDLAAVAFPTVAVGYAVGIQGTILKTATGGFDPAAAPGDDLPDAAALRLSPNPCRARPVVSWRLPGGGPAALELFDLRGRLLGSWRLGEPGGSFRLDTTSLPRGVYFLRMGPSGRGPASRTVKLVLLGP
jgi:photosystem II stability/assembly factor-like uncharacterized protein